MSSQTRQLLVVALASVGASWSCHVKTEHEPAHPVIHYKLSEATRALADGEWVVPENVQANISGSLDMLFGSPGHPQFLLLDEWKDAGFDLNWPQYPAGDQGSGEFSAADMEELREDNARAFRTNLRHIAAGDYGKVVVHSWSPDLQRDWSTLLAETAVELRNAEFQEKAKALFLDYYPSLASSSELYRQHCLHCHGSEGGGDGPTARFLNPLPRDYRHGTFKFTAVGKSVPRRADLFRVLDEGVTGTAMPSFRRFSKSQIHGLVDYVRLLSMRGMVERSLVATFAEESSLTSGDVITAYSDVWEKWKNAESKVLVFDGEVPHPSAASIARGKELFMDAKSANCFSCHGPEGRGNGVSAFAADPDDPTRIKPTYKDDWGHDVIPRNLRYGIFRGGRRPIDLYRRIKNGIAGTPMPEAPSSLTSDDIWALVHYVGTMSERPQIAHKSADAHGSANDGSTHDGQTPPAKH